jgi:APA family basic amino acid/polyamine antiporter
MTQVRAATWNFFLIWGALGVIVYFLYGKRNSNLEKPEAGPEHTIDG